MAWLSRLPTTGLIPQTYTATSVVVCHRPRDWKLCRHRLHLKTPLEMSNFTKKKFVHILHRQSFFKGKLKMQGNYCISAGDSKLSVEMLVIDEIVPTLLHALEDDETSDTALDGLKQILRELIFHMVMKIALKNHSAWSFRNVVKVD